MKRSFFSLEKNSQQQPQQKLYSFFSVYFGHKNALAPIHKKKLPTTSCNWTVCTLLLSSSSLLSKILLKAMIAIGNSLGCFERNEQKKAENATFRSGPLNIDKLKNGVQSNWAFIECHDSELGSYVLDMHLLTIFISLDLLLAE